MAERKPVISSNAYNCSNAVRKRFGSNETFYRLPVDPTTKDIVAYHPDDNATEPDNNDATLHQVESSARDEREDGVLGPRQVTEPDPIGDQDPIDCIDNSVKAAVHGDRLLRKRGICQTGSNAKRTRFSVSPSRIVSSRATINQVHGDDIVAYSPEIIDLGAIPHHNGLTNSRRQQHYPIACAMLGSDTARLDAGTIILVLSILNPQPSDWLITGSTLVDYNGLVEATSLTGFRSGMSIIIPLLDRDQWVLAVAYTTTKLCIVYDPLQVENTCATWGRYVCQALSKLVGGSWRYIMASDGPKPNNRFDYGICILVYAIHRMHRAHTPFDGIKTPTWRLFFWTLIECQRPQHKAREELIVEFPQLPNVYEDVRAVRRWLEDASAAIGIIQHLSRLVWACSRTIEHETRSDCQSKEVAADPPQELTPGSFLGNLTDRDTSARPKHIWMGKEACESAALEQTAYRLDAELRGIQVAHLTIQRKVDAWCREHNAQTDQLQEHRRQQDERRAQEDVRRAEEDAERLYDTAIREMEDRTMAATTMRLAQVVAVLKRGGSSN